MSSIQSSCHPERSEGPFLGIRTKVPRYARDDNFTLSDGSLFSFATLVAQAAHAAQPAVVVAGLARQVLLHLGMRQDQESLAVHDVDHDLRHRIAAQHA